MYGDWDIHSHNWYKPAGWRAGHVGANIGTTVTSIGGNCIKVTSIGDGRSDVVTWFAPHAPPPLSSTGRPHILTYPTRQATTPRGRSVAGLIFPTPSAALLIFLALGAGVDGIRLGWLNINQAIVEYFCVAHRHIHHGGPSGGNGESSSLPFCPPCCPHLPSRLPSHRMTPVALNARISAGAANDILQQHLRHGVVRCVGR